MPDLKRLLSSSLLVTLCVPTLFSLPAYAAQPADEGDITEDTASEADMTCYERETERFQAREAANFNTYRTALANEWQRQVNFRLRAAQTAAVRASRQRTLTRSTQTLTTTLASAARSASELTLEDTDLVNDFVDSEGLDTTALNNWLNHRIPLANLDRALNNLLPVLRRFANSTDQRIINRVWAEQRTAFRTNYQENQVRGRRAFLEAIRACESEDMTSVEESAESSATTTVRTASTTRPIAPLPRMDIRLTLEEPRALAPSTTRPVGSLRIPSLGDLRFEPRETSASGTSARTTTQPVGERSSASTTQAEPHLEERPAPQMPQDTKSSEGSASSSSGGTSGSSAGGTSDAAASTEARVQILSAGFTSNNDICSEDIMFSARVSSNVSRSRSGMVYWRIGDWFFGEEKVVFEPGTLLTVIRNLGIHPSSRSNVQNLLFSAQLSESNQVDVLNIELPACNTQADSESDSSSSNSSSASPTGSSSQTPTGSSSTK